MTVQAETFISKQRTIQEEMDYLEGMRETRELTDQEEMQLRGLESEIEGTAVCDACEGDGETDGETCGNCSGKGII